MPPKKDINLWLEIKSIQSKTAPKTLKNESRLQYNNYTKSSSYLSTMLRH